MLPFCLVDYILQFAGAYSWNKEERPYIEELHVIKDVLPAHGVRVSLIHLKEMHALEQAYKGRKNIQGLYADAWHLL